MSSMWAKGCMLIIVCVCFVTWHDYLSLVDGEGRGILYYHSIDISSDFFVCLYFNRIHIFLVLLFGPPNEQPFSNVAHLPPYLWKPKKGREIVWLLCCCWPICSFGRGWLQERHAYTHHGCNFQSPFILSLFYLAFSAEIGITVFLCSFILVHCLNNAFSGYALLSSTPSCLLKSKTRLFFAFFTVEFLEHCTRNKLVLQ